jgi:hypothetical protein
MNSLSDVFREEPIPFVIYNNDLRSKSNVILHLRKRAVGGLSGEEQIVFHSFKGWRKKSDGTFSLSISLLYRLLSLRIILTNPRLILIEYEINEEV